MTLRFYPVALRGLISRTDGRAREREKKKATLVGRSCVCVVCKTNPRHSFVPQFLLSLLYTRDISRAIGDGRPSRGAFEKILI